MAYYDQMTYTPTVVGRQPGYTFTRPGAKPLNLFGDAAEKLKLDIDQAKAAGPQKTALAGDQGVAGQFGLGSALVPAGAPSQDLQDLAERVGTPVEQPKPEQSATESGPSPAQRATEAAALPGQQQRQGMTGQRVRMPNGKLAEVGPDGQLYEIQQVAGQRKVTKEDLEKRAGEGTLMQTAQSQRGGFEPNQEFLEGLRENTLDKKLIAQQALDQNLQAAEIERRAAAADVEKKQAAEAERARLLQIQQDKMAEEEQKYTKARGDFRSAKIDQNRMYAGGVGTLKRIGGAISAAMGQWGSMVAGGPNNALMIIENAIDRDIDSQKQEIATKGAEADNALNDLIRRGMSMRQAEISLKGAQMENTAANTRYLAAQAAPGQLQNQFAAMANELDKNTLLTEEQYRRESLGEVTKQMQAMYPQEGRAGGTFRTGTMILQEDKGGGEDKSYSMEAAKRFESAIETFDLADDLLENYFREEGNSATFDVSGSLTPALISNKGAKFKDMENKTRRLTASFQNAVMGKSEQDAITSKDIVTGGETVAGRKLGAEASKKAAVTVVMTTLNSMDKASRDKAWQQLKPKMKAAVQERLSEGR